MDMGNNLPQIDNIINGVSRWARDFASSNHFEVDFRTGFNKFKSWLDQATFNPYPNIAPGIEVGYHERPTQPNLNLEVQNVVEAAKPLAIGVEKIVEDLKASNNRITDYSFNPKIPIPDFTYTPNFISKPETFNSNWSEQIASKFHLENVNTHFLPKYFEKMVYQEKLNRKKLQVCAFVHHLQRSEYIPSSIQPAILKISENVEKVINTHIPQGYIDQNTKIDIHFMDKAFLRQKLAEEIDQKFPQMAVSEKMDILDEKYSQEAPIHPWVLENIPQEALEDRAIALGLSEMQEAIWEKIQLIEEEGLLESLPDGLTVKEFMSEQFRSGPEKVKLLIDALITEVDKGSDAFKQKARSLKNKIFVGCGLFQIRMERLGYPLDKIYSLLGKAIFGKLFDVKPAFDFGTILISKYAESKINREELQQRAIKLQQMLGYEEGIAKAWYYSLFPSEDSLAFTPKDFYIKSQTIDLGVEKLEKGAIFFMNGVFNSQKKAKNTGLKLSQLGGGVKIKAIHNASHFWHDLKEAFYNLIYISTPPVEELKKQIIDYFEKNGIEKNMLLICHSQGTVITRNALMQLPPEIRERISVLAISPAAYIDRYLCGNIKHLVSDKDWLVPYIDKEGFKRCEETIEVLKSKKQFALMDHSLDSPTFKKAKRDFINKFTLENK